MTMEILTRPIRLLACKRVVLVSLLFLGMTGASLAQDSAVVMDLQGEIEPRCEFTQYNSSEVDFSINNDATINFTVYCNMAMTINLTSKNGALLNENLAARFGRLDEFLREYDAVLTLENSGFERTASSAEMQDGVTFSTGDDVVFDTLGALEIQLRTAVAGGHAGRYTDVISIAVSPSLAAFN